MITIAQSLGGGKNCFLKVLIHKMALCQFKVDFDKWKMYIMNPKETFNKWNKGIYLNKWREDKMES